MQNISRELKVMLEEVKRMKRFVRYEEGAEIYSMSVSKFTRLAKDARAVYKVDGIVLVDRDILEDYLETFRL